MGKCSISCTCEACGWYTLKFPNHCKAWNDLNVTGITCDKECTSFKTITEAALFERAVEIERHGFDAAVKVRHRKA